MFMVSWMCGYGVKIIVAHKEREKRRVIIKSRKHMRKVFSFFTTLLECWARKGKFSQKEITKLLSLNIFCYRSSHSKVKWEKIKIKTFSGGVRERDKLRNFKNMEEKESST